MEQIVDKRDWREVRGKLDGNYNYTGHEAAWDRAIAIFSYRLKRYYINPIKKLSKGNTGEGFPIVTAQCALIETFAAFRDGKVYDRNKKESAVYYKDSGSLFTKFLESDKYFKNNFGSDDKPPASLFYSQVRCGLIHEARTKGDWVIKADALEYRKKHSLSKTEFTTETLIKKKGGKFNIFRNQFQVALKAYFDQYKADLANPNNNELRKFFARKLDHLYDIPKDDFDWWKEIAAGD